MRILAIVLNILAIVFALFLFIREYEFGDIEPEETVAYTVLIICPIINYIFIFSQKGKNWLALYFKRKALEELVCYPKTDPVYVRV